MKNLKYNEKRMCRYCGREFLIPKSHLRHNSQRGTYCSIKCRAEAKINRVERICLICHKKFYSIPSNIKRGHGKYCSPSCAAKGLSVVKQRTAKLISCKHCGKQIALSAGDLKYHNRQFCSKKCFRAFHKERQRRICNYCGKEFQAYPYDVKRTGGLYCSRDCMFKGMGPSSLELLLYGALKAAKIDFIPQYTVQEIKTVADAYLPQHNALIYVNGNYWHSLPDTSARDRLKTQELIKRRYRVFRYSEDQINSDISLCVNKMLAELGCKNVISASDIEPIKREVVLELIKREKETRSLQKKREHRCLNCGKITLLPPKQAKRKYCSLDCLKDYHLKLRGVDCLICGKRFIPNSHEKGRKQRYCSRECANLGRHKRRLVTLGVQ
jgi:very-short-patch-repair endonuclease